MKSWRLWLDSRVWPADRNKDREHEIGSSAKWATPRGIGDWGALPCTVTLLVAKA